MLRWAAAIIAVAAVTCLFFRPPSFTSGRMDFAAFYCASNIVVHRGDPYRTEPLRTCEHRSLAASIPGAVVPAPLPPYALAEIAPVSLLPYRQASFAWFLLTIGAVFVAIVSIVELTGAPVVPVVLACSASMLVQALATGSNAPIAIAALAAAEAAVKRRRLNLAAVLLALGCMEPHIALPALIGVAVCVPVMRVRICIVSTAIAVATLAVASPGIVVEYMFQVLPQHAASELGFFDQYGFSSILYDVGVAPHTALLIGTLQYSVFVAFAVWWASRSKLQYLSIVVPTGLAVIGGTFLHQFQIGAALPLAFWLATHSRTPASYAAPALLSIPWNLLLSGEGPVSFRNVHAYPNDLAERAWHQITMQAPVRQGSAEAIALTYLGLLVLLYATARQPLDRSVEL